MLRHKKNEDIVEKVDSNIEQSEEVVVLAAVPRLAVPTQEAEIPIFDLVGNILPGNASKAWESCHWQKTKTNEQLEPESSREETSRAALGMITEMEQHKGIPCNP